MASLIENLTNLINKDDLGAFKNKLDAKKDKPFYQFVNKQGETIFHLLIKTANYSNLQIRLEMLEHVFSCIKIFAINQKNNKGKTALDIALEIDHCGEIVYLLLKQGANIVLPNKIKENSKDNIKEFLTHRSSIDINSTNKLLEKIIPLLSQLIEQNIQQIDELDEKNGQQSSYLELNSLEPSYELQSLTYLHALQLVRLLCVLDKQQGEKKLKQLNNVFQWGNLEQCGIMCIASITALFFEDRYLLRQSIATIANGITDAIILKKEEKITFSMNPDLKQTMDRMQNFARSIEQAQLTGWSIITTHDIVNDYNSNIVPPAKIALLETLWLQFLDKKTKLSFVNVSKDLQLNPIKLILKYGTYADFITLCQKIPLQKLHQLTQKEDFLPHSPLQLSKLQLLQIRHAILLETILWDFHLEYINSKNDMLIDLYASLAVNLENTSICMKIITYIQQEFDDKAKTSPLFNKLQDLIANIKTKEVYMNNILVNPQIWNEAEEQLRSRLAELPVVSCNPLASRFHSYALVTDFFADKNSNENNNIVMNEIQPNSTEIFENILSEIAINLESNPTEANFWLDILRELIEGSRSIPYTDTLDYIKEPRDNNREHLLKQLEKLDHDNISDSLNYFHQKIIEAPNDYPIELCSVFDTMNNRKHYWPQ